MGEIQRAFSLSGLPRFNLSRLFEPKPVTTKERAICDMKKAIAKRRNEFIAQYKAKEMGSQVLTYEPALDREVYKTLRAYRNLHADAYHEVLTNLNDYTRYNVETFIGERLNVGLSQYTYDIRYTNDGVGTLYGEGMDESLVSMISRGRDCRDEVANNIDKPRQEAEIIQFTKIQHVLGDASASVGTTVVSISPPGGEGSSYSHNFYDVFTLREDESGKRYVEARRYASGLSPEESLEKVQTIIPDYQKEYQTSSQPSDVYFLSHPVIVPQDHELFNNPDAIHKFFQGNPKAMSHTDFQEKILEDRVFSEMVTHYIQTLEDTPEDKRILDKTLDAIMNRADELVGLGCVTLPMRRSTHQQQCHSSAPLPLMAHINDYGTRKVREVETGCGSSGGFGEKGKDKKPSLLPSNMSSNPAGDFGKDALGSRTFSCPVCGKTNIRPYNDTIPRCQHCGSDKVAC